MKRMQKWRATNRDNSLYTKGETKQRKNRRDRGGNNGNLQASLMPTWPRSSAALPTPSSSACAPAHCSPAAPMTERKALTQCNRHRDRNFAGTQKKGERTNLLPDWLLLFSKDHLHVGRGAHERCAKDCSSALQWERQNCTKKGTSPNARLMRP